MFKKLTPEDTHEYNDYCSTIANYRSIVHRVRALRVRNLSGSKYISNLNCWMETRERGFQMPQDESGRHKFNPKNKDEPRETQEFIPKIDRKYPAPEARKRDVEKTTKI